ncbi:prostaglandin G/H synthase 1 isoform X2 [Leptonychotes weddellii]|uniref:Prostaglandin G/H synthase 1 n=1 Tax=Leptonychotes weddellii TaxID=9713 RepID=A0A7F8PXH8_LEPWE|nr:prostaglandin G/H synthase 1 isoform X2 [Leptonychotes weddellii]
MYQVPVNPCCYYPCQHQGICVRFGLDRYQCDCTRTGYSGPNCTIPELWTWLRNSLRPSPSFLHFLLTHGRWFWELINASFIRDMLMRLVLTARSNLIPSPPTYNIAHDYISWESFSNVSYYTRVLPSVPQDCPTPMGTKGKKQLPDAQLLGRRFLLRRKFIPDPQGSNLMFAFFAQHFTHQFFKTSGKMGPGFTKALGHGVDLGHIYGDNLERQYQLRLFKDGKLKYQVVLGLRMGQWERPPVVFPGRGGETMNPGRRCRPGADMASHVLLGGRLWVLIGDGQFQSAYIH